MFHQRGAPSAAAATYLLVLLEVDGLLEAAVLEARLLRSHLHGDGHRDTTAVFAQARACRTETPTHAHPKPSTLTHSAHARQRTASTGAAGQTATAIAGNSRAPHAPALKPNFSRYLDPNAFPCLLKLANSLGTLVMGAPTTNCFEPTRLAVCCCSLSKHLARKWLRSSSFP